MREKSIHFLPDEADICKAWQRYSQKNMRSLVENGPFRGQTACYPTGYKTRITEVVLQSTASNYSTTFQDHLLIVLAHSELKH